MNLIKVELENFKQFVDRIDIDIPGEAAIGVIGTNGVGKTTLFQAIEWCLYNPPSISGADIRPRGRTGNPKVSVTLESNDQSKQWIVERELKRGGATANIYETDENGEPRVIVSSTRDVTKYVTERLIGLSHRAFVATFFTRQKELHFFGDVKDTERRRDVGKLLGLENIRNAQKSIGTDRAEANNHAKVLREQYAKESGDRDFDAELAATNETIAQALKTIDEAKAVEAAAAAATLSARTQRENALARREKHNGILNSLNRAQDDETTANKRLAECEATIARLGKTREDREALAPVAARAGDLQQAVQAAEVERERFNSRERLEHNLRTNTSKRENEIRSLASEVASIRPATVPEGWGWNAADAGDIQSAVARLRAGASTYPINDFNQRLSALNEARAAAQNVGQGQALLQKYLDRRSQLEFQRAEVIADGEPAEKIAGIDQQLTGHRAALTTWDAERKAIESERKRRERVLANIRQSNFDDGCPTCGRKFSADDEQDVVEIFSKDIEAFHEQITIGDRHAKSVQATVNTLAKERETQVERQTRIQEIDASIAKSVGFIDEQTTMVNEAEQAVSRLLATIGLTDPPTDHDIANAQNQLALAQQLHQAIDRITIYAGTATQLDTDRVNIVADLDALGDVRFDAKAFQELTRKRDEAVTAATRIEGFDRELEQLPAAIDSKSELTESLGNLAISIAELKQLLFEVGYDPELLQAASHTVSAAEAEEKQASQRRQQAELDSHKAEAAKQAIAREHERIRETAVRADDMQREADELQLMYSQFSEFEQFVVSRLTPALSETTSELVRQVTDGRYDDVSFDDNFGILVRDGDENPFPLATFSGGERDVIALCARLALSQMIGQQAAEQPGFLVLDEVFGSLDRDRRTRMLDLFGGLSGVSDQFRQIFIISHVDDVRTAPVLDELWMVEKGDEGKSTITNLEPGTDIGEL